MAFVPDKQVDTKSSGFTPDKPVNGFTPDAPKPTIGGFAKQFGIGYGDAASMEYGLGVIKKYKGEEFVKSLESNVPVERFGRGLGRTIGLLTPGPSMIFKVGGLGGKIALKAFRATEAGKVIKAATEAKVGVEGAAKLGKFADSIAKTATSMAAYEAVRYPENTVKEKIITVPTAALFGAGFGAIGEAISPIITKIMKNKNLIDKQIDPNTPELKKLLSMSDDSTKNVKDGVFIRIKEFGGKVEKHVIDKYQEVTNFKQKAEDITGKKVSAFDDPNFQISRFLGSGVIADKKLNDLYDVIKPVLREKKILFETMKLERFIERAKNGFENPRGFTAEESHKALNDIKSQIGEEKFNQLIQTGHNIREKVLKPMIRDAEDIFGREDINRMFAKGESYTPFHVLKHVDENLDKLPRGSKPFSAESTLKATQGTTEDIADVGDSLIKYIVSNTKFIEGQRAAHSIINLRHMGPEMDAFIKPLRLSENVKERIGIFSNLKELIPERNKLDRLISVRDKRLRKLITEIDSLEQQGLNLSLKNKKEIFSRDMENEVFHETRFRNAMVRVPKKNGVGTKLVPLKEIEGIKTELPIKDKNIVYQNSPERVDRYDTKKFIENFIDLPDGEVLNLKSKILTRDKKLSNLVDELVNLRNDFNSKRSSIFELRAKAEGLQDVTEIPSGFKKVSILKNGIKEEYAVPEHLADAMNGLNKQTADTMSRMVGKINSALKVGATTYSAIFPERNIFRDYQMAKLTSGIGFSVRDLLRGFAESVGNGKELQRYLREGGGLSGPQSFYTHKIAGSFDQAFPPLSKRVLNAFNPLTYLSKVAQVSEETTRVGIFTRAIRMGKDVPEAVHIARNATIDFNRMGETMAVANLWVPFLAARTKGSYNVFRAAIKNPRNFAANAVPVIIAPAVYTYYNNTIRFPDVWDNIPAFEKQNNFIMIYGRNKVQEDGQSRYTDIVKIPKGDVGKIVANPIENFLEWSRGKDKMSFEQVALQVLSDVSPIEFSRKGELSGSGIASSLVPPPMKALIEATTNKNLFTGRDIIPQNIKSASPKEQYTEKTPALAIAVGDLLNISPLIVENTVGTMFGGAGRQVIDPQKSLSSMSKVFKGAAGNDEQNRMFDIIQEIKMDTGDKKANDIRFLKDSFNEYKSLSPVPEIKRQYINDRFKNSPELLGKFVDLLEADANGEMPVHRSLKTLSVKDRLRFIRQYSQDLKTPEEKMIFLKSLIDNKVITNRSQLERGE